MSKKTRHSTLTLDILSKTENLERVREFVGDAARDFGFPLDDIANIQLAVDEACTNIIKHAYQYRPDGNIHIGIDTVAKGEAPKKFIVNIFDNGLSFDPMRYSFPDMTEYFLKMRKGGLGIVLMRKLMDEVEFTRLPDQKNAIRLVKYLSNDRQATA